MTAGDAERLREIASTPEVARWWGAPDAGFPLTDEPDATRFTIWAAGRIAGLIQFTEEAEPSYRHASIDIFLDPDRHGQGLGSEAITALLDHLIHERGHHRVTIDPARENGAAVRCYEKAGFRPVGVMQAFWRDRLGVWRDGLLMELVRLPTPPRADLANPRSG